VLRLLLLLLLLRRRADGLLGFCRASSVAMRMEPGPGPAVSDHRSLLLLLLLGRSTNFARRVMAAAAWM
jgi:hypothetical protein